LSTEFIACADDFVAGKSILQYLPSEEEQNQILARQIEKEKSERSASGKSGFQSA
jgi:hypothetical protein